MPRSSMAASVAPTATIGHEDVLAKVRCLSLFSENSGSGVQRPPALGKQNRIYAPKISCNRPVADATIENSLKSRGFELANTLAISAHIRLSGQSSAPSARGT
jgi:hypothetical protein